MEAVCRHVAELIIGEDPAQIDYSWTKLYRDMNWLGQAGPLISTINAVGIVVWAIAGARRLVGTGV